MKKPTALTPDTMLRDTRLYDDAPVGNDVSDTGDLARVDPSIVARAEDWPRLLLRESDDARARRRAEVQHSAKSDDRYLRPKVRAPYVKPEIVSRELTLKHFSPCAL